MLLNIVVNIMTLIQVLLRVYFESGEFGAFLIECWSVCRRGDGDDGDNDDQCFCFLFFLPECGCRFPHLV